MDVWPIIATILVTNGMIFGFVLTIKSELSKINGSYKKHIEKCDSRFCQMDKRIDRIGSGHNQ